MKKIIKIFIISALVSACTQNNRDHNKSYGEVIKTTSIRYAKGFKILHYKDFTQIDVVNPWDTTQLLNTYILVDKKKELPKNLPEGTIVKIPVERVAFTTSVHVGIWNQLGQVKKTVAVCEREYITIPYINQGIDNGQITDIGMATNVNIEKLLAAKPDLLVISPYENSSKERFTKYGLAVAEDASYMEDSPLGRAEWIKFEAAFTANEKLAEDIFSNIEKRYLSMSKKAQSVKYRPTVFTEKKYADAWHIPGGNSYSAKFLKDAGANYIWSDMPTTGSVALPYEEVFAKAINADYWIIKYNNTNQDFTYNQLASEYQLYTNFKAFKERKIFAVNSGTTPYYEQGPLEPDVVLADLIHIFHPEILPDYQPKYYFKLKE